MAFHQPFQITGFHSCDRDVGLRIVNGKEGLKPSSNSWDWLGGGIYFWEQNPIRALEYAEESARGTQYNKVPIKTPFIIGAIIELGNCLNLVEPTSLGVVKQAHDSMMAALLETKKKIPVNQGANRQLDCAVIKYLHEIRRRSGERPFDTIRSPFHEAELLYADANFSARLHIEICVINPEMIKGYFLPLPVQEYNPYINMDPVPKWYPGDRRSA